ARSAAERSLAWSARSSKMSANARRVSTACRMSAAIARLDLGGAEARALFDAAAIQEFRGADALAIFELHFVEGKRAVAGRDHKSERLARTTSPGAPLSPSTTRARWILSSVPWN